MEFKKFFLCVGFYGLLIKNVFCQQTILIQLNEYQTIKHFLAENFTKKTTTKDLGKINYESLKIYSPRLFQISCSTTHLQNQYQLLSTIRAMKGVEMAQFNFSTSPRGNEPNDPRLNEQWHWQRIKAAQVWQRNTGGVSACGDTLVVAILDNGFDTSHTDLRPNIWENKREIANNNLDDDQNGYIDDCLGWNARDQNDQHPKDTLPLFIPHGTPCAGIVGAVGNNALGGTGLNWQVKLMLLSWSRSSAWIVENLRYVYQQRQLYEASRGARGAFVVAVSMSVGFDNQFVSDQPIVCAWLDSLSRLGVIPVVAVSNREGDINQIGDIPSLCPAPRLIAVAATERNDTRRAGGYNAQAVDVAAPGVGIISTYPQQNDYDSFEGNSFAAPQIAGAIALMWAMPFDTFCTMPRLAVADLLREAILYGGDPLPTLAGKSVTGRRINLEGTLQRLDYQLSKQGKKGTWDILAIYPNPSKNNSWLTLQTPENFVEALEICVYNSLGQLLFTQPLTIRAWSTRQIPLLMEGQSSGVYQVLLRQQSTHEILAIKQLVIAK